MTAISTATIPPVEILEAACTVIFTQWAPICARTSAQSARVF